MRFLENLRIFHFSQFGFVQCCDAPESREELEGRRVGCTWASRAAVGAPESGNTSGMHSLPFSVVCTTFYGDYGPFPAIGQFLFFYFPDRPVVVSRSRISVSYRPDGDDIPKKRFQFPVSSQREVRHVKSCLVSRVARLCKRCHQHHTPFAEHSPTDVKKICQICGKTKRF